MCISADPVAAARTAASVVAVRLAQFDENHELLYFCLTPEGATASDEEIEEEMFDRFWNGPTPWRDSPRAVVEEAVWKNYASALGAAFRATFAHGNEVALAPGS